MILHLRNSAFGSLGNIFSVTLVMEASSAIAAVLVFISPILWLKKCHVLLPAPPIQPMSVQSDGYLKTNTVLFMHLMNGGLL